MSEQLGRPIPPVGRSKVWFQPRKASRIAHLVIKGSKTMYHTACGVGLNRATAIGATSATMRCFECEEIKKGGS